MKLKELWPLLPHYQKVEIALYDEIDVEKWNEKLIPLMRDLAEFGVLVCKKYDDFEIMSIRTMKDFYLRVIIKPNEEFSQLNKAEKHKGGN